MVPIKIPQTENRGIQLAQLVEFGELAEETLQATTVKDKSGDIVTMGKFNMYHANKNLVKPLTVGKYDSGKGCSFVELVATSMQASKLHLRREVSQHPWGQYPATVLDSRGWLQHPCWTCWSFQFSLGSFRFCLGVLEGRSDRGVGAPPTRLQHGIWILAPGVLGHFAAQMQLANPGAIASVVHQPCMEHALFHHPCFAALSYEAAR